MHIWFHGIHFCYIICFFSIWLLGHKNINKSNTILHLTETDWKKHCALLMPLCNGESNQFLKSTQIGTVFLPFGIPWLNKLVKSSELEWLSSEPTQISTIFLPFGSFKTGNKLMKSSLPSAAYLNSSPLSVSLCCRKWSTTISQSQNRNKLKNKDKIHGQQCGQERK